MTTRPEPGSCSGLVVQLTEQSAPDDALAAAALVASGAKAPRSLSLEALERTLLEARAVGITRIVLTGGEPLLHERLNDCVRLLLKLGVSVEVVTTGYRLDQREPALRQLGKALAGITVELHGGSARSHERVTGRAGSFQEALGALELAQELRVPRRARLIPNALSEVEEARAAVVRFGARLEVDRASTRLLPLPRGQSLPLGECGSWSAPPGDEGARPHALAAVAATGALFPCPAAIGVAALPAALTPLLEVRLRDALAALEGAPVGARCAGCPAAFSARVAALPPRP